MVDLRILFVCIEYLFCGNIEFYTDMVNFIGNTCRSPMAEGVMRHLIQENDLNWSCDSAALRSWNIGRTPEERCLKVLEENGMTLKHYGRMITKEDFQNFDYILGMDESNLSELQEMANMAGKECHANVGLLGTYLENDEMEIIKDPYFSNGISAFHSAYDQIFESCQKFITKHRLGKNVTTQNI